MILLDDIGIYTDIYKTDRQDDYHHVLYHVRCKVCQQELYKPISQIYRFNKRCKHGVFVKEGNNRTVYGIGYNTLSKDIERDDLYNKLYDKWRHMIFRCTEKFQNQYPTYKGVTCSEEWKDFANFYYDVQNLQGFDYWLNHPNEMVMLDKDTLVEGNKLYSKDTCCFISHADSNRDVAKRHPETLRKANRVFVENHSQPIIITNKYTGEEQFFPSLKECCRVAHLNLRHIWMCLSKEEKYKSHKTTHGYIVRYANEELTDEQKQILEKYKNRHK